MDQSLEYPTRARPRPILIILIGLIGVGLIGWGGYQWYRATRSPSGTKTFTSALVNLSFRYSAASQYSERDVLGAAFANEPGYHGTNAYFSDTAKLLPGFEAITADFAASDSVAHDQLPKVDLLDASTDFKAAVSYDLGPRVQSRTLRPGMYLAAGHNDIEGTTAFPIYLFVEPPKDSGLKYLGFYLGDTTHELKESEVVSDVDGFGQTVTEAGIERVIALGLNDQLPLIKEQLAQALAIAETFTTQ